MHLSWGMPNMQGFFRYAVHLFLLATLCSWLRPGFAETAALHPSLKVRVSPLVLTASGGVSLGSYQAGLLYYGLRHLREHGLLDLRVTTGTSAGSVNALIAVIEACGAQSALPQDSLFWKTWVPLGLDRLLARPADAAEDTIFSRRGLEASIDEVHQRWMQGLSARCDVLLGISATRKDPLIEEVRPGFTIERYSETFVIRVRGRGLGLAPALENYYDPATTSMLLPFNQDAEHDFQLVKDLIYASTAVPLAFPAQSVSHCLHVPGASEQPCTEQNARHDLFFDGGVFDNVPMRLAHRLTKLRLGASPEYERVLYGFASVSNESYPEREATPGRTSVLNAVYQMWGDFVSTARNREVSLLFDEQPLIRSRLMINIKHLPLSSEHLTDFLGFIEGDFRRFDFYLGMYDARYGIKEGILKQGIKTVLNTAPLFLPEEQQPDHWQWGPIFCLAQYLEKPAGSKGDFTEQKCRQFFETSGEAATDYLAMAQASVNLFYWRCRHTTKLAPDAQSLCKRVFDAQATPPPVSPHFKADTWALRSGESEFHYFMRALGDYHFHFKDLGLTRQQAAQGMTRLEKTLLLVVDDIATRQPWGQGLGLRLLAYLGIRAAFQDSSLFDILMRSHTMLMTMLLIIGVGFLLMALERIFPARRLPHVEGWWLRVVIINALQAGVVLTGAFTWERWFHSYSVFHLTDRLGVSWSALLAYLVITLVFYFWHRLRHDSQFLWDTLHQVHHSPQRLETITSFYKHPLEILSDALLVSAIVYVFLGLSVEAGAWVTILTCYAEYFYHMNIKTPHWVGYFLQRPESHRFHHQLGRHYNNFSDLPIWDMIFGTFYNPKEEEVACGFKPEREARFMDMLLFRDVNTRRPQPLRSPARKQRQQSEFLSRLQEVSELPVAADPSPEA